MLYYCCSIDLIYYTLLHRNVLKSLLGLHHLINCLLLRSHHFRFLLLPPPLLPLITLHIHDHFLHFLRIQGQTHCVNQFHFMFLPHCFELFYFCHHMTRFQISLILLYSSCYQYIYSHSEGPTLMEIFSHIFSE